MPTPGKNANHPNLPPRPKDAAEQSLARALRWSAIVHGAVFTLIIFKGLLFPSEPIVYTPTLRVDLVGLPDVLKKDLARLPKAPAETEKPPVEPPPSSKEPDAPKVKDTPKEQAAPDEMVLKPKKQVKPDTRTRQKKLKSALDRIKALDKINRMNEASEAAAPPVLGNKVSKGTSLSGDAKESAEAHYFDVLRDRLRENWDLPIWLERQKFRATVKVHIDSRGMLRTFRFMKTSGNAQFDEAVKRTLNASSPFPAPPSGLAGDLLSDGVDVGFPDMGAE